MSRANENYLKLTAGYLFPEISRRVRAFEQRQPDARIIRLGIGDVVLPLAPSVCAAMHRAVDEMATEGGFRGYGPEQGYPFLREAIATHDFARRGVTVSPDEIFVSDELSRASRRLVRHGAPITVVRLWCGGRRRAFALHLLDHRDELLRDRGSDDGICPLGDMSVLI